jgi:hypothetical protein
MKKFLATLLLATATSLSLAASAPTNLPTPAFGSLTVTTNGVLARPSTNFFAVNWTALNVELAAHSITAGGGGGGSTNVATGSLSGILTNTDWTRFDNAARGITNQNTSNSVIIALANGIGASATALSTTVSNGLQSQVATLTAGAAAQVTSNTAIINLANSKAPTSITNGFATQQYAQGLTNGFVGTGITNGFATQQYAQGLTNGFVGTGITNGLAGTNVVNLKANNGSDFASPSATLSNLNGVAQGTNLLTGHTFTFDPTTLLIDGFTVGGYYVTPLAAGQLYYFLGNGNSIDFLMNADTNAVSAFNNIDGQFPNVTNHDFFTALTNQAVVASYARTNGSITNITVIPANANPVAGTFYGNAYLNGTFIGNGNGLTNVDAATLVPGSLASNLPAYLQNTRPLNAAARSLDKLTWSNAPVTIFMLGDSLMSGQAGFESATIAAVRMLKNQFGNAGTFQSFDSSVNAAYYTRPEITTGLQFPAAPAVYASDGASGVQCLQSAGRAATVPANLVSIYFEGWPRGGTISFNVTNSATNFTFTANGLLPGATNIFRTNISVVAGTNSAVLMTSTSGTNIPIGVAYIATNRAGIVDFRWAMGGTDIGNLFTVGTNAFGSLGTLINADLVFIHELHTPPNSFTDFNRLANYARGTSTSNAVVLIAPPPPNFSVASEIAILHQVVATNGGGTNGFYFADLNAAFPDLGSNTAAGLMLDTLHPNGAGAVAWGAELIRLLGFNTPANLTGMVTSGGTANGGGFTNLNAANITGNVAVAQLNSGTSASSSTFWRGDGTWATPTSSGVTSVGLSLPGVIFNASVTGSPVTSSGTLTPTLLVQTSNSFLAGPISGSTATPAFRAMVSADVPGGILNSNQLDTATKAQLALAGTGSGIATSSGTGTNTTLMGLSLTNSATIGMTVTNNQIQAYTNGVSATLLNLQSNRMTVQVAGSGTNELQVQQGSVTVAGTLTANGMSLSAGNFLAGSTRNIQAGFFTDSGNIKGYLDTSANGYDFQLVNRVTGNVNLMLKPVAAQTANLFEWQDSGGNITGRITPAGQVFTSTITLTNAPTLTLTNAAPAGYVLGTTAPSVWFKVTNAGTAYLIPGFTP